MFLVRTEIPQVGRPSLAGLTDMPSLSLSPDSLSGFVEVAQPPQIWIHRLETPLPRISPPLPFPLRVFCAILRA